jgi:outer membrane protein OmpA-like peptidoglycan-associated protein
MSARKILMLPCLLMIASCGSPPQPPGPDLANRRPANAPAQVEMQQCRNELHNTRIRAHEADGLVESTSATLKNLLAMQEALMSAREATKVAKPPETPNVVYSVRFPYGSTRVVIPDDAARQLIARAKDAPLIVLRGRTDGAAESAGESQIARERAAAVREFFISAGIDAARIRSTYQPIGDHVADNANAQGRSQNRRVEIEMYRQSPVAFEPGASAP